MRKLTAYSVLLAIVMLSSVWLHTFPHAYALTNYAPGVKAGNEVTYGKFSVNNTSPYPPFTGNVSSLAIQVKSVDAVTNTVTAVLVTTYHNNSQTNQTLTGTTDTGQGNLLPYILAGGLTAEDPLYKASSYFVISVNETVNTVYAGALRSVNVLNFTYQSSYQTVKAAYYWDVKTGLLLEAYENANFTSPSGNTITQIYFEATATNIWTPDTNPDFSFDASAQTAGPHLGETASYRLDLASLNRFNGTIGLAPSLLGIISSHPPSVTISSTSLVVSSSKPLATSVLTVSSNSSTTLGTYLISVNATSGAITHDTVIAVTIAPPDYTIAANPGNLTLAEGTSKTTTITVASRGLFTGNVALQVQSFGSGSITPTLAPSTVTLNSTATKAQAILQIAANSGVPPSVTIVYVNGVSGSIYRSTQVLVNVTGPDFHITATPSFLTFKEGQSATSTITLTSILGFSGTVNLSSSSYSPVTASLAKSALNLTAGGTVSTTLTVSTPATGPPGVYSVYVYGSTANNLSHNTYLNLNVTGPDFRFRSSSYFITVHAGQTGNATLTFSAVGGFSGAIDVTSISQGPFTSTVTPASVILNSTIASSTALLIVTVPKGVTPGYYSLSLAATSGSLVRTLYVTIQILGPDFVVFVTPGTLTVSQGGSGRSAVSVSTIMNFTGSVGLTATSPFGLQASVSPANVTVSPGGAVNSTLTVNVPLSLSPGFYYLTVIGTSGQIQHSFFVQVQVVGPDFSVFASPSFLTLHQGESANSTITLTSFDNFKAPVTITASAYQGSHVSVSPTSTTVFPVANGTATTVLTFSASATTPPGNSYFQVTATGGNLTRTTYVQVNVIGADFSLSVIPFSFSLKPGASAAATVTLSSVLGFRGNVTLSASAFPFNATLGSNGLSLTANGTTTTSLSIQVPATAQGGGYSVLVNATSGFITHTQYIFVQVITPDFYLQANPYTLQVAGGGSAQSTITITSLNGFNGTIALTTFGFLQSGVNATLSLSSVTLNGGSYSVTLTVSASPGAVSQSFYVTIQGTSGTISRFTSVFVTVTSPDFKLTSSQALVTIPRGSSSNSTLTIASVNGFSGNVSLTASLVGSGFNASLTSAFSVTFSPKIVFVASGGSASSLVNLVVPSSTPPSFYGVVVRATSGAIVRTIFIQVQVTGTFFTMGLAPSFLQLNAGTSGIVSVLVSTMNGFNGPISLSASSSPAGLNATLSPQTLTLNSTLTSASSVLTITVPTNPITGYYTTTVKGSSGGLNQTTSVIVFVTAFDFTLQAQPGSLTVFQGAFATSTISVSSINGFNGPVTLRALLLPASAEITVSLSTANLFVSGNHTSTLILTFSTSPTAAIGNYTVEIVAVGTTHVGTPFGHSVTISVMVTPKPDFDLSASPASLSIMQDSSGTSALKMTSLNSYTSTVSLTSTISLQGPTVSIADIAIPLAAGGTAQTVLTVSAGTNVVGYFTITVTASGGGISHSVNVQVYVAPMPDFSMTVSPQSLTVQAGSSAPTVLSMASLNGFTGQVPVFSSVSVTGVSISPNPATATLSSGGFAMVTVTVSVAVTTSPGSYSVMFTGNGTAGAHTASLVLTVTPPPDFAITSSTSSLVIPAGTSAGSKISIAPLNGFSGPVTLSSSAPTGLVSNFSPNPVLGGSGNSALTLSILSTVPVGNYTVTMIGAGGSFTHAATIYVTVSAAAKVTLTTGQVSYSHRVSVRRSGGVETWTMTVRNTGQSPAYFLVKAAGNSTSSGMSFGVKTTATVLAPGTSMTVTLSQSFTSSSVGLKFNFAITLYYGSGTYPSGDIISPQQSGVATGAFTVAN